MARFDGGLRQFSNHCEPGEYVVVDHGDILGWRQDGQTKAAKKRPIVVGDDQAVTLGGEIVCQWIVWAGIVPDPNLLRGHTLLPQRRQLPRQPVEPVEMPTV